MCVRTYVRCFDRIDREFPNAKVRTQTHKKAQLRYDFFSTLLASLTCIMSGFCISQRTEYIMRLVYKGGLKWCASCFPTVCRDGLGAASFSFSSRWRGETREPKRKENSDKKYLRRVKVSHCTRRLKAPPREEASRHTTALSIPRRPRVIEFFAY